MRQYRAKQKQAQQDISNSKATMLQNAVRNKLARNTLLQQKQNKANEVISNINQQRKADDKQSLIIKPNAVVMTYDILNNLFENPDIIIKRGSGRPKKLRRRPGRPLGSKNKNKQNKYYTHTPFTY